MLKCLFILLILVQTDPYSGTYTSNWQTLHFIDDNKCSLTFPTSWHGSKKQKFKWGISDEETIELKRGGLTKYTFKKEEINNLTYLVKLENLDAFSSSLQILQEEPSNNADSIAKERFLLAKEIVNSTLKK